MSIPIKLSHFTSTGTEANKRFQEQKQAPKPRDDWRVIFADKVTYPYNKVWDRDEQGHIKKDRKGAKMFNKVNAPFDGRIDEVLVEGDGVIIKKGQPIFKVTPDEKPEDVSEEELAAQRAKSTQELLDSVI